ncbi:hypothetical protein [Actinomyces faecalis]|uniref:hypothetical protein n=1 Tax=Actinomyces faecalis TaxID=2722820 RepID=UPI003144FD7B
MAERSSHGSRGPRRSSGGERHGFGRGHAGESRRGSGSSYRGADGSRGQGGYRRRDADQGCPYGDGERRRPARDGEERGRSYGDGDRRGQGRRGSDSHGQGGFSRSGGASRGGRGGSAGRDSRSGGPRRDSRPPQRHRVPEPAVPEDVQAADLEASARRELRGLGRANAENVSRHLVMVQRLLDSDPELAFQHARYAASHAGRIAVVREAAGVAAYLSGHYQDALRDIRAARRLSGLDLHRAIEADCERALGHLGRALKAAEAADPRQLDDVEEAEIAMVVSGVRHEMGQTELGLIVIEEALMMFRGDRETLRRLHSVRADRLEDLGRVEEAQAVRERIGEGPERSETDDVEVYDIEEESEEELAQAEQEASDSSAEPSLAEDDDAASTVASGGDDEADVVDDESDADWSSSFAERVEAEMAELLGETPEPGTSTQEDQA